MTEMDGRPWVCAGCGAVCTGAMSPGQLCLDCAASLPAARGASAVLRCPAAEECESCGSADAQLWVLEADTPVGVLCLTLCGQCADAGRTPRLSCPAAVGRTMAHDRHTGAGVAW
jgi:hypothetical protein